MKQAEQPLQQLPVRDTVALEKRTVWRVEEINMKDLKKGDKFVLIENGVFMYEGRPFLADSDGYEKDGLGCVDASII